MSLGLIPRFPALSPEDALRAQEALWALLRRQARLYAPESSSLPAETAAALTESVLLTLGADRDPRVLLAPDLPEKFRQGQRRLAQKLEISRRLWQTAWATRSEAENRSLLDTFNSLKHFPDRYDLRFFAQEIPCGIDYQLSQPVPETLRGVDYVNDWLRRLCLEQNFLGRFETALVRATLDRSCPDYRGLLINLYEPIAVNALGLALLGDDPRSLTVSPPRRQRLESLFAGLPVPEQKRILDAGAAALCTALDIRSAALRSYVQATALALGPGWHPPKRRNICFSPYNKNRAIPQYGPVPLFLPDSVAAHESRHLPDAFQRERRLAQGLHGNAHQLHGVVIRRHPVRTEGAAALAAVDDGPFAAPADPDGHRLHNAAAVRRPVPRLHVHVETGQAVGAVVAVIAAGIFRQAKSSADPAGKRIAAGMGLVIPFFKGFSLIFTVHDGSS